MDDPNVIEWLRLDRDPETIAEIKALASSPSTRSELASRFSARIAFGTAGLRARMQAGIGSMNSLIVIQATQGLARYAKKELGAGATEKGVVVGHDHRHRSRKFAELAAGVFHREGYKVYLLDGLVHTPMVPFTLGEMGCSLGLMITASHNPAADNGYKVYWANGVQIIPPHDAGIATEIDQSLEVSEGAWVVPPEIRAWKGTEEMKAKYVEMTKRLCLHPEDNKSTSLLFSYTAMHGVGLPFAQAAFEAANFPRSKLSVVDAQAQPDPDFPTVKFPNPEEKGALDLAIAHADKVGASIVLANDPDADRFCAAEKTEEKWTVFTGDQIGTLLGEWTLTKHRASKLPIDKLAMCASTVSSKMLQAMATQEGFTFRETLTGFKYLGNEALELEKEGFVVPFAYEEAIGFMSGSSIKDKDGVTALVSFCELATQLAKQNLTLTQHLDNLYTRYGFFHTSNSYFISRDPLKTAKIFSLLRYGSPSATKSSPLSLPTTLAGYKLTSIRDLTVGYDSEGTAPDYKPSLPVDGKSEMISFSLEGEAEVRVVGTVRTSGTEPKIKFYLEASGRDREKVVEVLEKVREALGKDWLRAEEFGLES